MHISPNIMYKEIVMVLSLLMLKHQEASYDMKNFYIVLWSLHNGDNYDL